LAANWRYVGETLGFSKVGNAFVYHGHRKGVFVYLLDRRLRISLREFPQRPNPKLDRVRGWAMMLHCPDWSPELFAEVGLTESSVAELGQVLGDYLDVYAPCFSRIEQQQNSETYLKGLLSDLSRKSIEPIALRYRDENAVRTLQMFLKDAPWDDQRMKQLYQDHVVQIAIDRPRCIASIAGAICSYWRFASSFRKNGVGDGATPLLTMPQALHLILAATTQDPSEIRRALCDVAYYQKSSAKAYWSHPIVPRVHYRTASFAQRNPMFPVELSGVFEDLAATRYRLQ